MARRHLPICRRKLRKLATRKDMSIRQVSLAIDVKWSTFAQWYYGRANCPPETVEAIAGVLECDVEHLLRPTAVQDMRAEMVEHLDWVKLLLDIGEATSTEYTKAWSALAPYQLVRLQDIAEKEAQIQRGEGIADAIRAIVEVGESSDGTESDEN